MITTSSRPPLIHMLHSADLLSMPTFKFDADYLLKIAQYLQKRINHKKFKQFPGRVKELNYQIDTILELHGIAKSKEKALHEEKGNKTQWPFYRTRLPSKDDNTIYDRLERKSRPATRK
jgi:hypothetical protein